MLTRGSPSTFVCRWVGPEVDSEGKVPEQTIFVVDDDNAMRESLEFLLQSVSFKVRSFENAEAFLAHYEASQPGCLLTDVRMPGMGGLALHEELRRRGFQIPVIVMTAYADVPMAVRAMQGGALDFIEKPFNDENLLDRLRRALDLDRAQRAGAFEETRVVKTPESISYPPERVGQYRIDRPLGVGGMSEVFLAEDMELNRWVALKFLKFEGEGTERHQARFRQEARAIAALSHPNIVTIFQILEFGNHLCIAMEYVEGKTLRRLIRENSLTPREVVGLAIQICEGLAEAHRMGIVHRDVKPENVIVDSRGRARLLDFGIAKQESSPRITGEGNMIGTPAYMAPEQVLGEDAGPHSDLFGLGVVLYESLVGELPFQGSNPLKVLQAIAADPPKPMPESLEIPEGLRKIVSRALVKEPSGRYPDAKSLKLDLETLVWTPKQDTETQIGPQVEGFRGSQSSRKLGWSLLVLLFLALVVAAGALRSDRDPTPEAPRVRVEDTAIAVLPFVVRGADDLAYLDQGLVELLSLKLDGAGNLRSVDPRALLNDFDRRKEQALPTSGPEIAQAFEARYFTQGSLVGAGREIFLDVALYDRDQPDQPLARASAQGAPDEVLDLLDRLAAQLLAGLVGEFGPRLRQIAVAASESLPAVKAYLRGEARFREGRYEEALEAYQEAVAEDPDFALAHYRLCAVADWVARGEISAEAAANAQRLKERLSEHDRRLLEALVAWRRGDGKEAERIYRAILGTFEDDVEAWFRLGEVLFHYGPPQGRGLDEAQEAFRRAVELEPRHVPSLWHLTRIAARQNNRTEVENLAQKIRELQPSSDRLLEIRTIEAFVLGGAVDQQEVLSSLRESRDLTLLITLWDVATFLPEQNGKNAIYEDALSVAELVAESSRSPEMRALGDLARAHLLLAEGRFQESLEALASSARFDPWAAAQARALFFLHPLVESSKTERLAIRDELAQLGGPAPANATPNVFLSVHNGVHEWLRLYLLGRLAVDSGERDIARKLLEALRSSIVERGEQEPGRSLVLDLGRGLEARIALLDGDEEAARDFVATVQETAMWYGWSTVSPFFSRSAERFLLADLSARQGRFEEALRLYDSFEEHALYDLIYVAPSHLRRAEIFEQLGDSRRAKEHYSKFLHAWENRDARFSPYVQKASVSLSRLEEGV